MHPSKENYHSDSMALHYQCRYAKAIPNYVKEHSILHLLSYFKATFHFKLILPNPKCQNQRKNIYNFSKLNKNVTLLRHLLHLYCFQILFFISFNIQKYYYFSINNFNYYYFKYYYYFHFNYYYYFYLNLL